MRNYKSSRILYFLIFDAGSHLIEKVRGYYTQSLALTLSLNGHNMGLLDWYWWVESPAGFLVFGRQDIHALVYISSHFQSLDIKESTEHDSKILLCYG